MIRSVLLALTLIYNSPAVNGALIRAARLHSVMTSAAFIIASPASLHAAVTADDFDMAACQAKYAKAPAQCLMLQSQADANAKNRARLARYAQCEQELEAIRQNNGKMPTTVRPSTSSPNTPATCIGGPTYQLNGFGDPSLPRIY